MRTHDLNLLAVATGDEQLVHNPHSVASRRIKQGMTSLLKHSIARQSRTAHPLHLSKWHDNGVDMAPFEGGKCFKPSQFDHKCLCPSHTMMERQTVQDFRELMNGRESGRLAWAKGQGNLHLAGKTGLFIWLLGADEPGGSHFLLGHDSLALELKFLSTKGVKAM
jgi:hypothetical protein